MSNDQQPAGIVPWTPPDPAEAAQILEDCAASARAAAIEHDRITGAGGKASGVRAVLDECAAAMDGAAGQWRRFVPYAVRTVRTAGPLPVLDDASAAAAGEAYATRRDRADEAGDDTAAFDKVAARIVEVARAGGPGGVPRWKLRNAVLPAGAPSAPFFVALVGALEAGDIERVPGDEPGSRYRATGAAPFRRWTVNEYATAVVWAARNVHEDDGVPDHVIAAEVRCTLRGACEPFSGEKFGQALAAAVAAGDLVQLGGEGRTRYRATAGPR